MQRFFFTPHNGIKKICDAGYFLLGISQAGGVYAIEDNYDLNNPRHVERMRTIRDFSARQQIIDLHTSPGGSTYMLTESGLYGFGNNCFGQLGFDSRSCSVDEVVCVKPSVSHDRVVDFSCGNYFVAVQSQQHIVIFGNPSRRRSMVPFSINSFDDIKSVKCGSYKVILQYSNDALVAVGDDHAGLLKRREKIPVAIDDIDVYILPEFYYKKIIDLKVAGSQMLVWCHDGIYVSGMSGEGQLGIYADKIRQFTRLDFFEGKAVKNVYLSYSNCLVHCVEGLYLSGLGQCQQGREFARIDIDPLRVTNVQLSSSTFIEIDGRWLRQGYIYEVNDKDVNKEKILFVDVGFQPIGSLPLKSSEQYARESPLGPGVLRMLNK